MPLLKTDAYTIDYIYNLPDGQRAELIDGRIYDMAPPSQIHQELLSELHYKIRIYIEKNNGFFWRSGILDCKSDEANSSSIFV